MKYDLNISNLISKDGINTGMYPVIIYQLIRQYSSESNRLNVCDITDTLLSYWKGDNQKASYRKNLQRTIKRNLEQLLYFDSNIHAAYKDGREFHIDSDDSTGKISEIWYEQELSTTDLQLLSDAVIYSKHLSNDKRKDILEKLMRASGQADESTTKWFHTLLKDADDLSIPIPNDFYQKLEYINDAIINHRCLSFDYSFFSSQKTKYKVRSYSGISPYKIVQQDGIYYLLASDTKTYYGADVTKKKNIPIILLEIHKIGRISNDSDNDYLPIESTDLINKSFQDIVGTGSSPLTGEIVPFKFNEPIKLHVDARGLDTLIDHFGNRILITKSTEKKDRIWASMYPGIVKDNPDVACEFVAPELTNTYDVTLKNARRNDWYELLILLIKYPTKSIELVEPQNLIRMVYLKMKGSLNYYETHHKN